MAPFVFHLLFVKREPFLPLASVQSNCRATAGASFTETAVSDYSVIDGEIACDGINEYIDGALQFSANPKKIFEYPKGSIHLHRTDGLGEWLLENGEDGLIVRREHAKGDVAVRGDAMSLLLFLWGRNAGQLEIFGDEKTAGEWSALAP